MNSAWGESYRLIRDCEPQLGRVVSYSGPLKSLSFGCLLLCGGVYVTRTHAEDMTMTLHRDFSAPVSAGEGACGGLVDRVLSQPMRCLVSFD